MGASGGRSASSVADMSCGIGGLAYGFVKAAFRVTAGMDTDEPCRYAFESNTQSRFICKSAKDITAREASDPYDGDGRRVLIGCAPCQPLSSHNRNRAADSKWSPLNAFARLARGTSPHAVSMENDPTLRPHAAFAKPAMCLKVEGYCVWHDSAKCSDYGVPRTRRRLVLLAPRLGGISMNKKKHKGKPPTVRDAIGDLRPIQAGCPSSDGPLHRSRGLSEANLKRISQTPQGGGWKDRDRRLAPPCHRKRPGKSYGSACGRMSWDRPAPAITTQCITWGTGRLGHPEQDRAPSLREAALPRTLPRNCKLAEGRSAMRNGEIPRRIGNDVPVALGMAIARSTRRHLVEHDGKV